MSNFFALNKISIKKITITLIIGYLELDHYLKRLIYSISLQDNIWNDYHISHVLNILINNL